jgi:hypothetical protein
VRDELLFLLTVTATNDNGDLSPQTIQIPIRSMLLYNSKNISISRSHEDHNLEEVIDASDPVFGYIAYPLAQISADQCEWILDPKYNTNIVVSVPFIEVNNVNNQRPISWTIPYAPLMPPIMPTSTPVWNLPSGFDQSLMTHLPLPPIAMGQTNNWQDFARFIWGQLTLGNY